MKKTSLIVVILFAVCAFYSCRKIQPEPLAANTTENSTTTTAALPGEIEPPVLARGGGASNGCAPTEVALIAGQHINSGMVSVTSDSDFVYVTYTTANGWYLTQTHLYVGDSTLIPRSGGGNPVPGQFPYKGTHARVTEVTYQVPASVFANNACVCVAAHAVVVRLNGANQVVQTETAWGQGTRINPNGGNWGMKFFHCACAL